MKSNKVESKNMNRFNKQSSPQKRLSQSYKNPSLPIEKRVKDLLSKMTLKEKIDQLSAYFFIDSAETWEKYFKMTNDGKDKFIQSISIKSLMKKKAWGQFCTILRDLPPNVAAEKANEIQKLAVEKTRLGIPVIIHDEGLHGLLANGATSFPQSIAIASSWDPELLKKAATIIGKESRARGITQLLSPTINIARDVRCGRTEETYGEDPYLTSRMAVAFIRGLQSQGVVATPKHYAANFVGAGGRDSHEIHFSKRILREIYFTAFQAAIKEAGALSIMSAYNSYDGTPCTCDKWLLMDVLRDEWKFKGFVVSDYGSVMGIYSLHNVAETKGEAGIKAIEAGLDIELPSPECFDAGLMNAVKRGRLSIKAIDRAVSCLLKVKFMLGLFENPYVNPEKAVKITNTQEHRKVALEMARKSIVLLKNNKNLLPLNKKIKSIAIIGPNADEIRLGGYSWYPYTKDVVITPLQGIKNKVSEKTKVLFAEGCKVLGKSKDGFKKAIQIAKKSDVAILFMGNFTESEGEAKDRANLNLPGVQKELIKTIAKTGVPTIVVLINGSAVTMLKWINDVSAVVEAWYPGEEGGNAIADVIFGDYNPGGKLPVTFPQHVGQLPLYYNPKPTGRGYDYTDMTGKPLFPFGYGLSYTTFEYSNLKISPKTINKKGTVDINFDVKNTGKYKGDEIVQLYVRDVVASMTRPVKELKGFKRITLEPKEKKKVTLTIKAKDLGFYNANMKYIVEPGTFEILIGSSSEDILLKGNLLVK